MSSMISSSYGAWVMLVLGPSNSDACPSGNMISICLRPCPAHLESRVRSPSLIFSSSHHCSLCIIFTLSLHFVNSTNFRAQCLQQVVRKLARQRGHQRYLLLGAHKDISFGQRADILEEHPSEWSPIPPCSLAVWRRSQRRSRRDTMRALSRGIPRCWHHPPRGVHKK